MAMPEDKESTNSKKEVTPEEMKRFGAGIVIGLVIFIIWFIIYIQFR